MNEHGRYTVSVPYRTEKEKRIVALWIELTRVLGKDKGQAILSMMEREVKELRIKDPILYKALNVLVDRQLEEGKDEPQARSD